MRVVWFGLVWFNFHRRGMLRDCASEWLHSRAAWEGLDTALREQGLKVCKQKEALLARPGRSLFSPRSTLPSSLWAGRVT